MYKLCESLTFLDNLFNFYDVLAFSRHIGIRDSQLDMRHSFYIEKSIFL